VAVQSRQQVHRALPETREIWSFGSGYGGNALLGKKCFALRIASVMARATEGWPGRAHADPEAHLAAGVIKSTSPVRSVGVRQRRTWPCSFPRSPAGRRRPSGADICWMKVRRRRPAVRDQPEAGLFGVAPHQHESNPNAIATLDANCIFTNSRPHRPDGDVWWEP